MREFFVILQHTHGEGYLDAGQIEARDKDGADALSRDWVFGQKIQNHCCCHGNNCVVQIVESEPGEVVMLRECAVNIMSA